MRLIRAAAIVIVAASITRADAAAPPRRIIVSALHGSMLVEECAKRNDDAFDACAGYVLGAADRLSIEGKTCLASGDSWSKMMVAVVKKYLRDHPERWSDHPLWLVERALEESFPCTSRK
jgi:hypothetical protein